MEDHEFDPYELQLLSVFESCDQEKKGTLSVQGLQQLCDKLEIEERGRIKLIDRLLGKNPDNQVTFHVFRAGLLDFLNQGPVMEQASTSTETVFTEEEATPKLMFGKKKYGRSSSPLDSSQEVPQGLSDNHKEDTVLLKNSPAVVQKKKRKTVPNPQNQNATEVGLADNAFVPLGFTHDTEVLVRANVPVDRNIQAAWEISSSCSNDDQVKHSTGEDSASWYMYDTTRIAPIYSRTMNAETVVKLWATACVQKPLSLLQDLGFTKSRVDVTELISVLKDELFNLQTDGDWSMAETLLQAVLSLCQEELLSTKRSLELVLGERDKLQMNIMEANERASLLAQEVDENHAQLEKSANVQIKLMEQKHTENTKNLMEQLGLDREYLQAKNTALKIRVKKLEEVNSQQRTELSSLKEENSSLSSEKECAILNWSKIQSQYQTAQKALKRIDSFQDEVTHLKFTYEVQQILPMKQRIKEYQDANTELRDRNDELTMKIEALTLEMSANKMKDCPPIPEDRANNNSAACDTDEEVVSSEALQMDSAISVAPSADKSDQLPQSQVPDEGDIDKLVEAVLAIELDNQKAVQAVDLREQNAELQKSLELMREEYEICEDYWSTKVEEERTLHDQEYNTLGNKYTELLEQIKEYEREMERGCSENADSRLPTIPEHVNLEEQITHVEEEYRALQVKFDQKNFECRKVQSEKLKLYKYIRRLETKQHNIDTMEVGLQGLEQVRDEIEKLHVLEDQLEVVATNIERQRRDCDAAQEAAEAHIKEQKESIIFRLCKQLHSPREKPPGVTCTGVRCCNGKCNENKLALFHAMRNQAKMMTSLQKTIARQKREMQDLAGTLQRTKELHETEVEEFENLLAIKEEKVKIYMLAKKKQDVFLMKNDLILTDVYEENARLIKNLAALELRCKDLMLLAEKPSTSMGKTKTC